tara:strand:- start:12966 stop:13097 length:132 start_codon:yes stop_codon:yes gene_type:complete
MTKKKNESSVAKGLLIFAVVSSLLATILIFGSLFGFWLYKIFG